MQITMEGVSLCVSEYCHTALNVWVCPSIRVSWSNIVNLSTEYILAHSRECISLMFGWNFMTSCAGFDIFIHLFQSAYIKYDHDGKL